MNNLLIPPSPNWFSSSILACAPDNTVIYGSRNELVVINPTPSEESGDIKILTGIHSTRVVSVAVNRNWGNPNKWAVSVGEDNVVQLLDISTCTSKISHVGHKTHADKVVGAEFAGEDRVISVSEKGFIIIWKLSTSNLSSITAIKDSNVRVSTISICPHATWLIAIGTKKGGILISDLKKSGRIIFRIKAHEEEIVSLSWCPAPHNVFAKKIVIYKRKNNKKVQNEENQSNNDILLPTIVPQAAVSTELTDNNIETDSSTNQRLTDSINLQEGIADVALEEEKKTSLETRSDSSTETLTEDKTESNALDDQIKIQCEKNGDTHENNVETNVGDDEVEKENNYENNDNKHEGNIKTNESDEKISDEVEKENNCENNGNKHDDNIETYEGDKKVFNEVENENCENNENNHEGNIKTNDGDEKISVEVERENNCENNGNKHDDNIETNEGDVKTCDEVEKMKNCENNGDKHKDNIEAVEDDKNISDEMEKKNGGTNNLTETKLNGELTKNHLNKQEFLLASSGRGSRSIKIWRAGTDSLLEAELVFPKAYSSRAKSGNDRGWITTCWVTPRSLLSSGSKAQLLHWRLDESRKNNEQDYKPRLLHTDHSKQLFCIAAPIRKHESADDEDWRDKNLLNVWSLGSDRFILNTSLGCDHKMLSCYATIGGSISCLVPSPIDPTRIACGMGDGNARMIDLSRPHLQTLSMNTLYDKTQIKITSFAWHPKKEACLAYGTYEGHVGLIDTSSTSKNITELVPSGNHPVYHLQWGPLNDDLNHELYVISNSKLVAYDVKKPLNGPTEFDINNGIGLTSFVWKHDYSTLAVATKNCELLLYDNQFKLMATFLLQSKTVRCLEWHPPGTAEENWLALSTNQIIVYDCSANNLKTQNKYEDCAIAVFSEHQGSVHALSWSPHQSELLASAGEGIALVWNVKTKTLLHACVSQFDILYDVLWSPLDADYLITGGRGCVLRIWKLSENSANYKIDKAQQKQTLSLEKSQVEEELSVVKVESKSKRPAKCLLNGISQIHNLNVHSNMLEDCIKLFNSLHSKNYENPCENTKSSKDVQPSVFNILDLFDGKEGIDEILKLERENHANRTTPLCMESISLWQGNIGDTIKNAIMCDSLNHWLISIAPMVSYNLWQEACEAYAKQLLNESNNKPVEAAYYFLACHKVEEAIDALCFGSYYREALILAKSRLSTSDPVIDKILQRWASYSTSVGKYEIAAQCYIVLNMLEEAAKVLFRRTDVPILEFCVKLAEEIDNEELLKATMFRLNAIKSAGNNKSEVDDPLLPLKSRAEIEIQKIESQVDNSVASENEVVASVAIE